MGGYGMARLRGRLILMLLTTGCALWLWSSPSPAQSAEEARPDVRVVVDVSGSMKENDPDRLALSALDLLVALLPNGATAGVWTFGGRVDNPLPLGEVDAAWRERAMALPPALQDYQQHTDIETALREAARADANGWRHLVLLTDGMIDLSQARGVKPEVDEASRRRLVNELANELAGQGVSIHAIAFSDQADLALAQQLAQTTGGLAALAENPERLLSAFLDIVERIFPADQVPLEAGRFTIDQDVEIFSALVFQEPDDSPLTLVAPDGTRHRADASSEGMRWQVEPRFDLIRVPNPQVGEWRLEGAVGEGSRINVASPLQLRTVALPTTLYLGFDVPVIAWLARDGEPLGEGDETVDLSVSLKDTAGRIQSRATLQAEGDRFRGNLPAPALTGNARLEILAEGETFHRQRVQAVNVLPAIGAVHRPQEGRVELVAVHPRVNRDNTAVHGVLQGERLEARAVGASRWHLDLPELDDALRQPLLITATIELEGEARELTLPRLLLNPDGRTGIDVTDPAGPALVAERLDAGAQGAPSRPSTEGSGASAADRFVALVNRLPEKARELWQSGLPGLQHMWMSHGRDPRLWGVVALALLAWLVVIAIRRRRPRGPMHREEPHV